MSQSSTPNLPFVRYFKNTENGTLSSYGSSHPIGDDDPNIRNHQIRGELEIEKGEFDRLTDEQEQLAEAQKDEWVARARADALRPASIAVEPDPIADARAALQRAFEHLETLQTEIARYKSLDNFSVEVHPYGDGPFRVSLADHVEATFRLRRLKEEPTPPAAVGAELPRRAQAILGDLLMNARNALDYIAYGLSIPPENNRGKAARKWKSKVAFPIHTEDPFLKSDNQWVTRLRGVSKPARDLIESFQPYMNSDDPHNDPLAILSKAVNTHKHAELLRTVVVEGSPFGVDVDSPLIPAVVKRTVHYDEHGAAKGSSMTMSGLPNPSHGLSVGEEIASGSTGFVVPRGVGYVEFKADVQAPLRIILEDVNGRDVIEASRDIVFAVSNLIRKFAEVWDELVAAED